MTTFNFIDLYVDQTNKTRTIVVKGDLKNMKHLFRWMVADANRGIAAIFKVEAADIHTATDIYCGAWSVDNNSGAY